MARCDNCLANKVCDHHRFGFENCGSYISAADVAPKSEVDRLQAEVKVLTENSITSKYPCCVSCSNGLILTKSLEEYDKLLADIANEVAREIFGEIETLLCRSVYPRVTANGTITPITSKDWHIRCDDYDAIKKKYTEG